MTIVAASKERVKEISDITLHLSYYLYLEIVEILNL